MRSCEKPGMMNGLVVQISAFGPVHETGRFGITPTIVCDHAVERERASDHIRIAAEPRFPEMFRDHRDIGAFLFLRQKCAAADRAQAEHIEIIRRRLEDRNLERIAQSGHASRRSPFSPANPSKMVCPSRKCMKRGAESGKSTVCSLKCEKTWSTRAGCWKGRPRRNRSLIRLKIAVFSPIPSASVSDGEQSEPGRFEQLPKSETKIGHHGTS